MGCFKLYKGCSVTPSAPTGNPDPTRWTLLDRAIFDNGVVLKVKYTDATNFGGVKILVFRGTTRSDPSNRLDPHFQEDDPDSPIARFVPTDEGWLLACDLATSL